MTFSNIVSYMAKILTFYIIMTRTLTLVYKLRDLFWIIYELMIVENQNAIINNEVRAIEQILVLDPVK